MFFGTTSTGGEGTSFGCNDLLDIPNMGRFIIVKTRYTLDADDPMKNIQLGFFPRCCQI